MKILITGGAGFIGSNLIKFALRKGHSILNIDKLTYAGSLRNLSDLASGPHYRFKRIDICNQLQVRDAFEQFKPEAIMHLAAESHVDQSINSPESFLNTNVNGTFTLLQEATHYWNANKNFESFRFVHISTDEVYGSLPDDPTISFDENTPYNPRSPYSASKASSDHLVNAWHATYDLPTVITNCSNNYGPFQHPEKLIPKVITSALTGQNIPIYGDGLNVRDWLYVDDHCSALLDVLLRGEVGAKYNIGGQSERKNIELVELICSMLDVKLPRNQGSYCDLITFVCDRAGHDRRYAVNSRKIQKELNWSAKSTLRQGLDKTIDWYISNDSWWLNQAHFGTPYTKLEVNP